MLRYIALTLTLSISLPAFAVVGSLQKSVPQDDNSRRASFEQLLKRKLSNKEATALAVANAQALEIRNSAEVTKASTRQKTSTYLVCFGVSAGSLIGGQGLACLDLKNQAYLLGGTLMGNLGYSASASVVGIYTYDGNSPEGTYDGLQVGGSFVGGAGVAYMGRSNQDSVRGPDDSLVLLRGFFGFEVDTIGGTIFVKKVGAN